MIFCFLMMTSRTSPITMEPPWRVLVVDDEEDVHAVTSLALGSFEFDNRELQLLHAYSGEEASGC